jgi:2-oxoglutarate dehydrogenase E1 component
LIKQGILTTKEAEEIKEYVRNLYESGFQSSKTFTPKIKNWLEKNWSGFHTFETIPTGISMESLKEIGTKLSTLPDDLTPHRGVSKIFKDRLQTIVDGEGLDWGTCEALAYGSLVLAGCPVRIAGQDCERGTFSHRHALIHDQKDFHHYIPHEHLSKDQAEFRVVNSNLSEFAALGFELGYSIEHPNILVLWEAQFGDFANGAQVIFDQFISCGEKKWYRQSGLTVLLPHGYDGNGPEHSSGRTERYLQMVDEHPCKIPESAEKQDRAINFSVVNCTTPANFFHVLRRQIMRGYRKPLIVMTPKKLLKSRNCKSSLKEMSEGTSFIRMIPDERKDVERLYFCSGQIYYDLEKARDEGNYNYGIARLEQMAPFPFDLVIKEMEKSPNAKVYWVQEEHMNMGPWTFVQPRFETCLEHLGRNLRIKYIGRDPSAAPSTGIKEAHETQHKDLMNEAFPEQ